MKRLLDTSPVLNSPFYRNTLISHLCSVMRT